MRRALTAALLALAALAVTAGLALAGVIVHGSTADAQPASQSTITSVYGDLAANRAAAQQAAAALLALAPALPGAVASTTEPAGDGGELAGPPFDGMLTDLADAASWATMSAMSPPAVIADVGDHLPASLRRNQGSTITGGDGEAASSWSLPASAGLNARTLAVTAVRLTDGSTGVRFDGEATWTIPRSVSERIPAAITGAVLTGRAQTLTTGSRPAPRSLGLALRRSIARRLAAYVNALPVLQPSLPVPCPAQLVSKTVTVRVTGTGGRTLALAREAPSGCGSSVALTVGGHRGRALQDALGPRDLSLSDELVLLDAVPACRASSLTATTASVVSNAGATISPDATTVGTPPVVRAPSTDAATTVELAVTNRTRRPCTVRGFPRVSLTAAGVPSAHLHQIDQDARAVHRSGRLATTTTLYPRASAGTTIEVRTCPRAPVRTAARLTLPGAGGPVTAALPARPAVRPCAGARLTVSALTEGVLPIGDLAGAARTAHTPVTPVRAHPPDGSAAANRALTHPIRPGPGTTTLATLSAPALGPRLHGA